MSIQLKLAPLMSQICLPWCQINLMLNIFHGTTSQMCEMLFSSQNCFSTNFNKTVIEDWLK